jgi:hypothetical protein
MKHFIGRTLLLTAAFVATLGSISLAQFGGPGVNSTFNGVWNFVWEPSTGKATYSATTTPFAAVASARTILTINGSATKTVRVRRVIISGTVPVTALTEPLYINKVSSATPSTGTSVVPTKTPLDSNSAAATAVVENFTANPTDQTLVGEIMAPFLSLGVGTTVNRPLEIDFGKLGSAAILRSASEGLAINLAHVTTASTLTVSVEWTEE